MSSIERAVDSQVLERMVGWLGDLPGFKRSHASDSLFVAEGYLGARANTDKDQLFLLALDVTYWYWIDDRTDESLDKPTSGVDWERLFAAIDHAGAIVHPVTPEADFLSRLSAELAAVAPSPVDHAWWLTSAERTLRAFHQGERISRGRLTPILAEYLETGSWSSTIRNILSTASILYRMDWANRRRDTRLMDLERYLALIARLENDAYGFEKERREGCFANAVLLMERHLPTQAAKKFIDEQREAYEALLGQGLASLAPDDPFAVLANGFLEAHRKWYGHRPERYAGAASSSERGEP